jgi:hypothetical protein
MHEEDLSDDSCMEKLGNLQLALKEKLEWLAKVIQNENAESKKFKEQADFFNEKANARKNRAERTKKFIHTFMNINNVKRLEGTHLIVSLQKNPPSVVIKNEDEIPVEYLTIPDPVINKKKISEVLKQGIEVKGAELQQTESVRIR